MGFLEKLLLSVAKTTPRGTWPILKRLSSANPELRSFPINLSFFPGREFHADLSDPASTMLFKHGCPPHLEGEIKLYERMIREGDCVYDVGANIGVLTILFLKLVGSSGEVHSFEPTKRAFATLERNVFKDDPVHPVNKAVGSEPGVITISEADSHVLSRVHKNGNVPDRFQERKLYEVPLVTLDGYLSETKGPPPKFLKIDVEGFESEVFRGAKNLLNEHRPIMLFEAFNDRRRKESFATLNDVVPNVYEISGIMENGDLVALPDLATQTENFLAVPEWARGRLQ